MTAGVDQPTFVDIDDFELDRNTTTGFWVTLVRDGSVVDELTSYFDSLTLAGKLAALDILGRIRPLHTVPWLEQRLDDAEPDVRARACHALGCIGDPRTAPLLVRALEDEAWPGRRQRRLAGLLRAQEQHAVQVPQHVVALHVSGERALAAHRQPGHQAGVQRQGAHAERAHVRHLPHAELK